jgi:hypothetical protein
MKLEPLTQINLSSLVEASGFANRKSTAGFIISAATSLENR